MASARGAWASSSEEHHRQSASVQAPVESVLWHSKSIEIRVPFCLVDRSNSVDCSIVLRKEPNWSIQRLLNFPDSACWRRYPGGSRSVHASLSSWPAIGLPLVSGGSASALACFEACSAFTSRSGPHGRWTAQGSPLTPSASIHVVTSTNRPAATSWSDSC